MQYQRSLKYCGIVIFRDVRELLFCSFVVSYEVILSRLLFHLRPICLFSTLLSQQGVSHGSRFQTLSFPILNIANIQTKTRIANFDNPLDLSSADISQYISFGNRMTANPHFKNDD